jgi:hypothetical protein
MAKRRAQRRDPMDSIIESALQPGRFIRWNEGLSFVSGLRHLEGEIAKVVSADPARAVTLYETFIAGWLDTLAILMIQIPARISATLRPGLGAH